MTLITGSIPLDTLIGSVVTTGATTEHACEHRGHVTGFRISLDGRILISFSTGIDLVWGCDEHTVPSFNLQSTPNHMWSEND